MNIEWNRLRTFNGSQNAAFEALCAQLAECEPMPDGSTFTRKGAPDAGIECYWRLPDGQEQGWQAKFFTSVPGTSQWGQLDKSVRTALKKHPNLSTLTMCLPIDRPDPRLPNNESFMEKWDIHVNKWKAWAKDKSMSVNFPYWGEHEIWQRLSKSEHRGRYYFWFNQELFDADWFSERFAEVRASVGPRYTPELNVELPISRLFDALGRNVSFFSQLREKYVDVVKALKNGGLQNCRDELGDRLSELHDLIRCLTSATKSYEGSPTKHIDWHGLGQLVERCQRKVTDCDNHLRELAEKEKHNAETGKGAKEASYPHREPYEYERYSLRRLLADLYDFHAFTKGNQAQLANQPALLLSGDAGTGKTHLFCDVAQQRLQDGSPTILLLGQRLRDEEPWAQLLRHLDLSCTHEEFLGALESAAQLSGKRALILIDALNEGPGRYLWKTYLASALKTISRCKWIGIGVSVRTSYERLLISDDLVPTELARVVHTGFAEHEYQATKTYFDHYGIERPTIPLLTPEFENPLFLSCLCKGMKKRGLTRIPPGIRGITSVFDFFVDSVNEKLAHPDQLNFDQKANLVHTAIERIAENMAVGLTDFVTREHAQEVCDSLLPGRNFHESLFAHLISEGILSENVTYGLDNAPQDIIQFSYNRLQDHLVLRQLKKHLDKNEPSASFEIHTPLGTLFADEWTCCKNQGLLEALAIQIPETIGSEIYEVLPHAMQFTSVCEAFISSLAWREPKTLSDKSLDFINNHIFPYEHLNAQFLNVLLSIAPIPEHPYNADFLHRNLTQFELAERDSWWSVFLYQQNGLHGAVDRLLDWAWSKQDKTHLSDESVRLAGKALAWFLTTSHRFVRDRATKAMVNLFTNRIDVLRSVIIDFLEVNDPYVKERIFAVAYGCALRSDDTAAITRLAQDIYKWIFETGHPHPHILLRDYARGVIEVALHNNPKLDGVDPEKIRPPYQSKWPLDIPSKEDIQQYREWRQDMPNEHLALHSIYWSVMEDDFGRYIIGTNSWNFDWSTRRLADPRTLSRKEVHDQFVESLTTRQHTAWKRYNDSKCIAEVYQRMDKAERKDIAGLTLSDEQLEIALCDVERRLRNTLDKKKLRTLDEYVIPYLNAPHAEKNEYQFDLSIAQHWIVQRASELLASSGKIGKFDRYRESYGETGRAAYKAERLGKKYQWIAYHEFLAHVADNLEFEEDSWSGHPNIYVGPWQRYLRDLDPSCLIRSTPRNNWEPHQVAWWAPVAFDDWTSETDNLQWLRDKKLLPCITELIPVTNPKDQTPWLVLDAFYNWEQPSPPEEERFDIPRQKIWYMLKSYIVKKADADVFYMWAKNQSFMGSWMPEAHEQTRIFLGEFFWAPAFQYHNTPYYNHDGWTRGGENKIPCEVLVTADIYMQERGGYDSSIDDTVIINLPAKWIVDEMRLTSRGQEGCYFDEQHRLIAWDPSVYQPAPGALLLNKPVFTQFLSDHGYEVVWTILGEKDIWGGDSRHENWLGQMEISGALRIQNGEVVGSANVHFVTRV